MKREMGGREEGRGREKGKGERRRREGNVNEGRLRRGKEGGSKG